MDPVHLVIAGFQCIKMFAGHRVLNNLIKHFCFLKTTTWFSVGGLMAEPQASVASGPVTHGFINSSSCVLSVTLSRGAHGLTTVVANLAS